MILEAKYRTILTVALPLMASSFIQSLVLLTDTAFLTRYEADPLAYGAVGNGGLIFMSMMMLIKGMGDGGQILIARRIGQGKQKMNPSIAGTGVLINWIIALLIVGFSFSLLPKFIMSLVGHPEIGVKQLNYIQIRSWGTFFSAINFIGMGYFIAKGKTKIVLIGAVVMALFNIILDSIFIFGWENIPAGGLKGAAWASVFAEFFGMLFYLLIFLWYEKGFFQKMSINLLFAKQLIKVSSPIMLQGIVALSTWTVFFFWIEQMGIYELNVSQNIRSIYFLAFIPIYAFGGTTKTYISQYLGNNRSKDTEMVIQKIQIATCCFLFLLLHGMLFYPEKIIEIINPNEEYLRESGQILRFVFGSVMIYGFTSIYFYTISGSGNTRFTFYIEVVAVILYLLFAYLTIKILKTELIWVWIVEYVYFIVLGGLSYWYLRTSNWKKKKI